MDIRILKQSLTSNGVKRGYYPLRFWWRFISLLLILPTFLLGLLTLTNVAGWSMIALLTLQRTWWANAFVTLVILLQLPAMQREAAFQRAREMVRQAAAAGDDTLTDAYTIPDAATELLPLTLVARTRLRPLFFGIFGALALLVISIVWGLSIVSGARWFGSPATLPIFGLYMLLGSALFAKELWRAVDGARITVIADYGGVTLQHLFTKRFMAWSDVRLFFAPVYATSKEPIGLVNRLVRRIAFLQEHADEANDETLSLEQCQLASIHDSITFPALRDERRVPLQPAQHDEQVQRFIAAIMQQSHVPLRLPSAEGIIFVARALPYKSRRLRQVLRELDADSDL